MILALFFGVILSLVHFFNEKIEIKNPLWNSRAVSFVAGISVTYTFLSLLPEAYSSFERFDKIIFVFIVAGFTTIHVVEKYFYQRAHRKSELQLKLKEIHYASLFLYNFLLGTILVELSKKGSFQATLFFIPLLFYASVGLVSIGNIHRHIINSKIAKYSLSASTVLGVIISDFLLKTTFLFDTLFAFMIGIFIYIALIDFIPREKRGEPAFFTFGVIIYVLLITTLTS